MKKLVQELGIVVCSLILFTLPVKAAQDTVSLQPDGNQVEATLEFASDPKTDPVDEILSLQLSFQVKAENGSLGKDDVSFIFDSGIQSVVKESRYHADTGILTIYISGTKNLASLENLILGRVQFHKEEEGATYSVKVQENSLKVVNGAFYMDEKNVNSMSNGNVGGNTGGNTGSNGGNSSSSDDGWYSDDDDGYRVPISSGNSKPPIYTTNVNQNTQNVTNTIPNQPVDNKPNIETEKPETNTTVTTPAAENNYVSNQPAGTENQKPVSNGNSGTVSNPSGNQKPLEESTKPFNGNNGTEKESKDSSEPVTSKPSVDTKKEENKEPETTVKQSNNAAASINTGVQPKEEKKLNTILWLVVVLIAIIVAALVVTVLVIKSPNPTKKNEIKDKEEDHL